MEISLASQDVQEVAEFGRCDDAASQGRACNTGQGSGMEWQLRAGDRFLNGSGGSGVE